MVMSKFKHSFLLLLMCLFLSSCKAEDVVYSPLFNCTKRIIDSYGVCTHINRLGIENEYETRYQEVKNISDVGSTILRTDFDWNVCQKGLSGSYNFVQHEKMLSSIRGRGLQTIGIFWPLVKSRSADDWLQYVTNVVYHFKKSVFYWEVVNEIDLYYKKNSILNPEEYVSLLKDARRSIKRNNRKAIVICGSLADIGSNYVRELFRLKFFSYFDIMNIHWYANKRNPESLIQYLAELGNMMKENSIYKAVWLTETGSTSAPGWDTEEIQAYKLPRLFLISYALGVDKVFWYKTRSNELSSSTESHFGLWHCDYTPKKAFYAYQTLVAMCPNRSTRPRLTKHKDVYSASWKNPSGINITALWTSFANIKINFDFGKFPVYDVYGQRIKPSGSITISPSVIYIEGNFDYSEMNY